MRRSPAIVALSWLLLSCGGGSPPPPAPPVAPAASPDPPPTATASVASAAPPPEPPSPFFPVIVHAASSFRYFAFTTGGIAVDGDWMATPIRVDDKGARVDPAIFTGLKGEGETNAFLVYSVSGDWPRSGSLGLNLPGERGGTDVNYVWTGTTWIKAKSQPMEDMPPEVVRAYYGGTLFGRARWGGQSLFYVVATQEDGGPLLPRFVLGGKGKGKPPIITRGTGACPTRLVGYTDLALRSSGDLTGLGKLCTGKNDYGYMGQPGGGALAVERWPKGSATSVIEALPGTEGKGALANGDAGILECSPTDRYVHASFSVGDDSFSPYVAHHDGRAWSDISPPSSRKISALWVDDDGTLWIEHPSEFLRRRGAAWEKVAPHGVAGEIAWTRRAPDGTLWARFADDLWHLTSAGAWEKAILPRDSGGKRFVADSVFWQGGEMVVVARGGGGTESALLGTRKRDQVLDLEIDRQKAGGEDRKPPASARAFGLVVPPTPGCKNLFVVLYKLSRVAPPDYDFPLTREALKGHTEFSDVRFAETEDGGARYLIARVPSFARGQKLLSLVREKVKNSKPQMFCGEPPRTNRVITINLRTGALEK